MDENFTNVQIESYSLPSVHHVDYQSLERDYLKVSLIGVLILAIILLGGAIAIRFVVASDLGEYANIVYLIPIIIISLNLFFVFKGFRHKSYALREHDILYKRGYIWRSQTVVPFNRVQHCEVDQGPIERLFNISKLKIYTAGGSSSDVAIPGLKPELANNMKDFIMRKIPSDEEE